MTTTHAPPVAEPRSRTAGLLGWLIAIVVVAAVAFWAVSAGAPTVPKASHAFPADVVEIEGTDLSRVTLTADAAKRIGLQTGEVRSAPAGAGEARLIVPEAALIYDAHGKSWVYAVDGSPLSFVRHEVTVVGGSGDDVWLSKGPAPGVRMATVGSVLLFGTEFEVGH